MENKYVITNKAGDMLAYFGSGGGTRAPKWTASPLMAKRWRTLRGCRCAATRWRRRFMGTTFTATMLPE